MKKAIAAICIMALLAAVFVASMPRLLSTDTVRQRILSHLQDLTGMQVTFRGDASVSFNPFLGIEVSDLIVSDPASVTSDTPLLTVERVAGKLKLLPALVGNIEIEQYQLFRPVLKMMVTSDGTASWHFTKGQFKTAYDTTRQILETGSAMAPHSARIGAVQIIDGAVDYQNEIDAETETASNINGTLIWPQTDDNLELRASAIWRNENVEVEANIQQPMQLMAGGQSGLRVIFGSEPLNYIFTGKANLLADLFVKGQIDARSPSISRLSQFLKLDVGQVGVIGEWTANGTLDATTQSILLADAAIGIDGNSATGVARLAMDELGGTKLDGTLAFGSIDISSYFTGSSTQATEVINREQSDNLDVDLRISAQSVTTGNIVLENVASAITVHDGSWKFDIGDAEVFGGQLAARLESERAGDTNTLVLKISANDTDISEVMSLLGDQAMSISGTGNIDADLRTVAPLKNFTALEVNGSASISANSGQIVGIDLPALLNGEQTDTSKLKSGGATDFETFSLKFFLNDSNASISKANIVSDAGDNILLIGDMNLRAGTLALRAQKTTEDGPEPERLVIGGTLSQPLVSVTQSKLVVPEPEDNSNDALEPESEETDADG
ncbi:MAG: AsmA family protein [Pseudomonadota bacterium]